MPKASKGKRKIRAPSPPPPPTQPPAIIRLIPPEILHQICSILPLPDLGNLRLTCKHFSVISQRHLVKELHVMYTIGSFVNLDGISEQNHLRKHVRKIVYEPMMLENMDEEEWMGCMREILEGDKCGCEECREEDMDSEEGIALMDKLQIGWKFYKSMLESQLALISASTDCHIFSDVLRKFSGLEEVVISGRPNARNSPWLKRTYENTFAIEGFLTDGGMDSSESALGPVRGMINGLGIAELNDVHLKILKIKSLGWGLFDYPPVHIGTVFRHLRTLKLCFAEDLDGAERLLDLQQRHRNLGNLLKSVRQLESLDVRFGCPTTHRLLVLNERERRVPVFWSTIFPNTYFSNLHTLRLQNVTCHVEEISSFFIAHASTLRILKLTSLWLEEPTMEWSGVFETMRQHLKLEGLVLGGVFGGQPLPDEDQPSFLSLYKTHSKWLAKAIVYGKEKMEQTRKKKEEAMMKINEEKDKLVRPCPHKYFMEDPIKHLDHYTGAKRYQCPS